MTPKARPTMIPTTHSSDMAQNETRCAIFQRRGIWPSGSSRNPRYTHKLHGTASMLRTNRAIQTLSGQLRRFRWWYSGFCQEKSRYVSSISSCCVVSTKDRTLSSCIRGSFNCGSAARSLGNGMDGSGGKCLLTDTRRE